jgi:3-hydroxyisobutyrate dehydrogenase
METIAVLGTGHMGAPIARRLLRAGYPVTVWNRTSARAAPLTTDGAHVAGSPSEAVGKVDVVITMLTDAAALEAVLFGAGGAAPALRPGTCLVEMSTIGPAAVHAVARRLPAGVDLVDAPVAGSVDAAEAGRLAVLAGGEAAAVDRVLPILAPLGTLRRCGGPGSGAALKLVLNTALVTALGALADTLAVADAVGVDRGTALDALGAGALGGAVARATATGASFSIALARKDLDLALAALGSHGGDRSVPIARAAAQVLAAAPDQTATLTTIVERPDHAAHP